MQYKIISLGDTNFFEFVSNKTGWKKEYYRELNTNNQTDHYPVYTASEEPVAFVDLPDKNLIKVNDCFGCFSFASNGDGSAGKNFVIHDRDFYISNDRTVLKIKDPSLLPEYVIYSLRSMKVDYGFCFAYKATPRNLRSVTLEVPVSDTGEFEVGVQRELSDKFENIKELQRKAVVMADDLEKSVVSLNELLTGSSKKTIYLSESEIFSLGIGKRILKKDQFEEGVPAYSANVNKPFGFIQESNLDDFSSPSLIWSIDGVFDWRYIPENTEFATTDHCGRLTIKAPDLCPKYVYHALKSTKDQYGFDRTYRASLRNISRVVYVDVPVDKNGDFDLDAQITIAERYEKLENAKGHILEQLEILSSVRVTLDG